MTGRAVIIIVVGIIIVAGITLFNIEAASTAIVKNVNNVYSRNLAHNIAESGVNLALTKLGNDRSWRAGFSALPMFHGLASVSLFDTMFEGLRCICVRSTGTADNITAVAYAYGYFPPGLKPISVRALITLHASNLINGTITVDGREHDIYGNLIPNSGTYGVWTTGSTFDLSSASCDVGGTKTGVDYAPSNPANPATIALNQPATGYPNTPDSAFGGPASGYPEGTLKAIAMSGVAGSQYTTDPATLQYPLSGVTYVDLPPSSNVWVPTVPFSGGGVLIVHNAGETAQLKNPYGQFTGILLGDDIVHLHGTVIGAIIGLTTTPGGNVIGNGTANILYSTQAITSATSMLANGNRLKVVGWYED